MQMRMIDPASTTVAEIHEVICDTAVRLATGYVENDSAIPRKWKGPVFRNGSPYNDGRLVLEIVEEYQGSSDQIKERYRKAAVRAIQNALMLHQDFVGGLIIGEMKAGRNYFNYWAQAPSQLF